ncbi:MAG: hypothetical protein RH859_07900 [Longimicrobiales bacterium]
MTRTRPGHSRILVLLMAIPVSATGQEPTPTAVAADFRQHRIFVEAPAPWGEAVRFFTDSGGGFNMLMQDAVEHGRWEAVDTTVADQRSTVVAWPEWLLEALPSATAVGGTPPLFRVVPRTPPATMLLDASDAGVLGRTWYVGRRWYIDYAHRTLAFIEDPTGHRPDGAIPLALTRLPDGTPETGFASFHIHVAGARHGVLFDTGASGALSPEAQAAFGAPAGVMGMNFVSESVAQGWLEANPGWRVVRRGTLAGGDVIEVPCVEVAGHTVGPVLFETRPAGVFETQMSEWTDGPIVGAAGGELLRHFSVVADYPGGWIALDPVSSEPTCAPGDGAA